LALGLCVSSGSYKLMLVVWCWGPTGHK
jgi:hypothetical protein